MFVNTTLACFGDFVPVFAVSAMATAMTALRTR